MTFGLRNPKGYIGLMSRREDLKERRFHFACQNFDLKVGWVMPTANPTWLQDSRLQRLMAILEDHEPACARFVGGCVRDAVLGRDNLDVDIATKLEPDVVDALVRAAGYRTEPTGVEHGTVTAIIDSHAFEITTLRQDVETDGRRAVVAFTRSWEEDAQRRDFTMNALYMDRDGVIYDPTACGLDDLAKRRIVFVGDAETRIREDYLRILRFYRFTSTLGLRGDGVGRVMCQKLCGGLASISGERIAQEFRKLFMGENVIYVLDDMVTSGIFDAIFPAVPLRHNLGVVLLRDALMMGYGAELRFAARLAFLFGASSASVQAVADRLKLSNEERTLLRGVSSGPTFSPYHLNDVRKVAYSAGAEITSAKVVLSWAENRGTGRDRPFDIVGALELAKDVPVFPVRGADVIAMGMAPGKGIGEVLSACEKRWIDGGFPSRDEAFRLLRECYAEHQHALEIS